MANNEVKNEQVEEVKASNETNDNVAVKETETKKVETKKLDNKKQDSKKVKKVKDNKPSAVAKTMSELKKVSWPSFGQVVKQTSVVIVVALVFLLVIFGLDRLCSWLIGLICG